jgi:hypothetical protein
MRRLFLIAFALAAGTVVAFACPPAASFPRRNAPTACTAEPRDELAPSFDHLVGEREQRRRNGQAERLGGLEVEHTT